MPDETAPNDNTEKRLYNLSARCPAFHHTTSSFPLGALSFPYITNSFQHFGPAFLHTTPPFPHVTPAIPHITPYFPRITNSFQHIAPAFHHTTLSSFPRGPSIPHISPSLSSHNLLLSARLILLSTTVIDVARLIRPPIIPLPKEKAVS